MRDWLEGLADIATIVLVALALLGPKEAKGKAPQAQAERQATQTQVRPTEGRKLPSPSPNLITWRI